MADYTPVTTDQAAVTLTAGSALTGGQLVKVTAANSVVPTTANSERAIGIVASDTPSGGRAIIYLLPGVIHEAPIVNAVVAAVGDAVTAGASARIDKATTTVAGTAGTLIGIYLVGGTGNAGGTVLGRFIGA